MSSSNCCFLTCIQISQEAGQVIWYSHLFQKERGLLQSISKFLISKPRKLSWIIHHPEQCSQKKYPAHYRLIPEEIPPLTAHYMLLLLLSHFSRVRLCVTPQTVAHQARLSLGFSMQEYWSVLPFPSPMHACMLSRFSGVWLCGIPGTAAHQAPLSLGFSRQEHWSGLPFPSPAHYIEHPNDIIHFFGF